MSIVASSVDSVLDRSVLDRTSAVRSWQSELKHAVRDPVELCRLLKLPESYEAGAIEAARQFALFAPLTFVSRMRTGDPADPLLRQVLPLASELTNVPGFSRDPLEESRATAAPGLLHKYRGRALIVATGVCAVHCRYCFRRHFPYPSTPHTPQDWRPALAAIRADEQLHEVILSGGDPLMLVDHQLADFARRLARIAHVRRLRIHSRLPVVIPQRVTDGLLAWLRGTRLTPIMVLHINHPAEIDAAVEAAVARLVDAGVPVLNQAVLLRGVNDSLDALHELCERLIDLRVMPYYLHQLDRVAGAAHFEVPESEGRLLVEQLRERLPGYAVPRYARETADATGKTILA